MTSEIFDILPVNFSWFYDIRTVATLLDVSVRRVKGWLDSLELNWLRVEGERLVPFVDLMVFCESFDALLPAAWALKRAAYRAEDDGSICLSKFTARQVAAVLAVSEMRIVRGFRRQGLAFDRRGRVGLSDLLRFLRGHPLWSDREDMVSELANLSIN